jgi:hypothetical protein
VPGDDAAQTLIAAETYGLPEAAESRSKGEGTKAGLRFRSDGPTEDTSSGPSAGGAGSTLSVLAYCWRILSSRVPFFVVLVVAHAGSNARASRQEAILIFILQVRFFAGEFGSTPTVFIITIFCP